MRFYNLLYKAVRNVFSLTSQELSFVEIIISKAYVSEV